jgi:hypothetical protein
MRSPSKFIRVAVLLVMLLSVSLTAACRSETDYGQCVGVNDEKDPALVYKYSTRNIIIGLLFAEMIAPPVVVILNELQCPVGRRTVTAPSPVTP